MRPLQYIFADLKDAVLYPFRWLATNYYIEISEKHERYSSSRTLKFKFFIQYVAVLAYLSIKIGYNKLVPVKNYRPGNGGTHAWQYAEKVEWINYHGKFAPKLALDYDAIEDTDVDGINHADYPDYCDAFISAAAYRGRDMSERELDTLNDNSDFVHTELQRKLY